MKVYLDESKSFYKANMHCHTTNSDGNLTPEKVKEEYMKRGYSVVAYTDHEHIINCSHLTDENFLAITSFEMNVPEKGFPWKSDARQFIRTAHLNFYATTPDNDLTICTSPEDDTMGSEELRAGVKYDRLGEMRIHSPEAISKIIKYAHEKGFLVCYNHPVWSLEFEADYLNYEDLDFVEIYNTSCEKLGLYAYDNIYDVMVKHGRQVACIAADDNHNSNRLDSPKSDSFGGWIMINAEKLDYESIIDALKKHNFYASSGPKIYSLTREGNIVTVKTSPARKITKQTEGRNSEGQFANPGELITEARFSVKDNEKTFRITVEDEHGYK
ncbi:MAG: PHP domain-containing protein, partial [Ruminococcaceae bacterium]|nr:PHP domain-containing protein [Oscillospiraceae bacterium]